MSRIVSFGLALVLAGCDCAGEPPRDVDGPTPYTRCHLAEPSGPEERTVGALTLRRDGRALTVEGLGERYRVAVGAGREARSTGQGGAGEEGAPPPDAALIVQIGGEPVADPDALVLWIAGSGAPLDGSAPPHVVDTTSLRSVRAGPVEWIPAGGAPAGRYARVERPCGFAEADVDAWALPAPEAPRVLLSWAGPASHPATRGRLGVDAGSETVGRIMEASGASAALFAWPTERLSREPTEPATDLVAAVAPTCCGAVGRADGRRVAAGWTLFEVGPDGLARVARGAP